MTPIKAIRNKCLACKANHYKQVRLCPDSACPIHPYRLGKRPLDAISSSTANDDKHPYGIRTRIYERARRFLRG